MPVVISDTLVLCRSPLRNKVGDAKGLKKGTRTAFSILYKTVDLWRMSTFVRYRLHLRPPSDALLCFAAYGTVRGAIRVFICREGGRSSFFTHCTSEDGNTLLHGVGGRKCAACDLQDLIEITCNRARVFSTKLGTNTLENWNGGIAALCSKRSDFLSAILAGQCLPSAKKDVPRWPRRSSTKASHGPRLDPVD